MSQQRSSTNNNSNGPWSALLPVALVGTDRHVGAWPAWQGDVGALIAQAVKGAAQPATAVLRSAAVLASCQLAGTLGSPTKEALPAAAAPEPRPELNDTRLVALAASAFARGHERLQHDVLTAIADAGMCLPAALLPDVLDASRRSLALRPAVAAVLGTRGVWLAAQRDEWKHAAGVQAAGSDDESRWSEGSLDQRRSFLQRDRARDAQAARTRLEAALPELPASERADLVAVLAEGLSIDDAPLLDKLRADRSREVRQAALKLLLRLPHAAHPQRAAQRVAALTKLESKLLRKRWTIDAPEAAANDWGSDNIDADKPKHEPLGERAWWLHQLARQVPLSWWTSHMGMTPPDLLAWAAKTDWHEALVRAWFDVLLLAPDAAWAEAFCDHWPMKALRGRERDPVMALLEPTARDARWLRLVEAGDFSSELVLGQMLAATTPPQRLSPALSMALVAWAGSRLGHKDIAYDWNLRQQLPQIACILDASSLPALAALPRSTDETPALAELMHTLAQIVAVRQAFAALPSATTSASSTTSTSKPTTS
jgi:Family of unknown function (DUF5691)